MNREDSVYFFQKSDQRNDVSKCLGEGNVLSVGGAEGNLCLKAGTPEDRATKGKDNISSATLGTMGILCMFMSIETSKVSIRVTVHTRVR